MAQESALAIIRDARSKFDKEIVDALVEVVRAGGTRK
jgi:HD-GYP domain-containing protein (c-di-GMP phosphodiesterase class II)